MIILPQPIGTAKVSHGADRDYLLKSGSLKSSLKKMDIFHGKSNPFSIEKHTVDDNVLFCFFYI